MSSNKEKGQSYINVSVDSTFLQNVMCCNSDFKKSNIADTPKTAKAAFDFLKDDKCENIAIEIDAGDNNETIK